MSGIQANEGYNIAILGDNGTEFKYKVLNKACDQLGIKRLFSNLFNQQGNAKVENVHNVLKQTLSKFLDSSDLEWDELLPFTCYCYKIFPRIYNFHDVWVRPAEGCLTHLNNSNRYYGTNKGKMILKELHK